MTLTAKVSEDEQRPPVPPTSHSVTPQAKSQTIIKFNSEEREKYKIILHLCVSFALKPPYTVALCAKYIKYLGKWGAAILTSPTHPLPS